MNHILHTDFVVLLHRSFPDVENQKSCDVIQQYLKGKFLNVMTICPTLQRSLIFFRVTAIM